MVTPRLLRLMLFVVVLGGCAPAGPEAALLAKEPDFAATMPGARQVRETGSNPEYTVEGGIYGYVARLWATESTAEEIAAWHAAALEEAGWEAASYPYITMGDGHFPEHAWRRGHLVMGLGFPDPTDDSIERLDLGLEDGSTLYHTSITYRSED